jgi:hypothetical protein
MYTCVLYILTGGMAFATGGCYHQLHHQDEAIIPHEVVYTSRLPRNVSVRYVPRANVLPRYRYHNNHRRYRHHRVNRRYHNRVIYRNRVAPARRYEHRRRVQRRVVRRHYDKNGNLRRRVTTRRY